MNEVFRLHRDGELIPMVKKSEYDDAIALLIEWHERAGPQVRNITKLKQRTRDIVNAAGVELKQ